MHLLTFIRVYILFYNKWRLIQRHTTDPCTKFKRLWSTQIYITSPPPQGSVSSRKRWAERLWEPMVVAVYTKTMLARHGKPIAHRNSQQLQLHAQYEAKQSSSMGRKWTHEVLPQLRHYWQLRSPGGKKARSFRAGPRELVLHSCACWQH